MKKALFSLLAAAVAAAVPVHAATFVKDVMLIGHPDEDEIAALKSTYADQGWTVIDQDLNKGAGGDFIYLLCRFVVNPDNVNDGYITDFAVYTESGTVPESQTYDGRDYRLVPFDGGQHFTERQGDLNSNAGGANIHLYYTKDAFPDDRAVVDVWFSSSSSGAVGKFGETDGYDLNRYADGDYIYMHAPAAPHGAMLTVNGMHYTRGGAGWTYAGGHVVLSGPGPFVLSTGGVAFTDDVGIVAAADCAVTFSNLVMDVSANNYVSPFTVTPGTEAALTLVGTNSLAAGEAAAGLAVVSNDTAVAALVIGAADTNQTLTANGGTYGAGIGGGGYGSGGTVTINGGSVAATGGTYGAGIGGGEYGSGGTVAINGGSVSATGGFDGAGIGGGGGGGVFGGAGGMVTINGGTVTATGRGGGAGIGGGSGGAGGTVAINGGSVSATGDTYGAGIGGGYQGAGGMATISGGAVTATGGQNGAGIGGGYQGAGGMATISGGRVTATGGYQAGGIGAGFGEFTSCGPVEISGGTVVATAGENYYGDFGGYSGIGGPVTFSGGSIRAAHGNVWNAPSNGTARVWCVTVPNLTPGAAVALSGLPVGYGTDDIFADAEGKVYLWLPDGRYEFTANGTYRTATVNGANVEVSFLPLGLTVNGLDIAYASGTGWSFDGATVTLSGAGPFVLSTGGATFTDGVGIVAAGNCAVTFDNLVMDVSAHQGLSPFTVTPGTETALTLVGTNSLSAGTYAAGLTVVSNAIGAASLVIGAADTSQTLTAKGGANAAGIGGGYMGSGGRVTISGGAVTATGGASAAGIGGGSGGSGGRVTISGGMVTAKGGLFGAGIGGGFSGSGGAVTISGGAMTATGGSLAADIGGGRSAAGGTNTFTGGSILAASVAGAPSNGAARVWPVAVTGLADGAAPSLPWLPATYGTNGLVAVGGQVCVWLPTGNYAYGEPESDGAGGMRCHAVLVDAEGNVTFGGWVSYSPLGLTVNGLDIAYANGTGWIFDGATVSLVGAGPFVLSTDGANFTSNVAVVAQADCAVTFSNLEVFAGNHAGLSPFTVAPGVSVALTLEGNTVLRAGSGAAAITVVSNATGVASLTIDADATDTLHTLGANGGNQGAGIGGGDGEACGSVTILGGLLTVEGGANAAGIGGGRNGAGGAVTISGGLLNVKSAGSFALIGFKLTSVNGGAAIGGGYQAAGGSTAISGGTISLTGVGGGAAVGPGEDGAGGTTAITGGSILARGGAVEPSPSNGVARVWPVIVSSLVDGAAVELSWLPADYGTNDLVAVGGEVCVWLPTGDYPYGEAESDGAGGWRRHAVLVDAEGNVTLDGWVTYSSLGLTVNGLDIAVMSGTGWTFDGGHVVLSGAGPFVLSTGGATFTDDVGIVAAADCAVTFSNLVMDVSANKYLSPFTVTPGTETALTLVGTNSLAAGERAAGLAVVSNDTAVAALVIDAADMNQTLSATGGKYGAGIGGGVECSGGTVVINGGSVTATGGDYGAGIGGGRKGDGGMVTISGGTVSATGGLSAAGIGGGYEGAGGILTINGGTVTATGGIGGAGIGGGRSAAGGTNTFAGGSILASSVGEAPTDGSSRVWPVSVTGLADGAAPSLPWLPADYGTNDIVAVGGEVCVWLPTGDYAYGEPESDGAGGMRRHAVLVDAEGKVTLDGWVTFPLLGLTVNGADIAFESGAGWSFDGATVSLSGPGPFVLSTGGATFTKGIGIVAAADCAVTFSNLVMDVSANEYLSPFTVTPGTETALTLVGANSLTAGEDAAGLTVVKNGDTAAALVIDAADMNQTLSATGGQDGSGIGGGYQCSGGTVTINGGRLTVDGGANGAGIGGGAFGAGGTATINGGVVSATGGYQAGGIGAGFGELTSCGPVEISGGTVVATAGENYYGDFGGYSGIGGPVTFTGGSIRAAHGNVWNAPSNGTERVWCVTVKNLAPGAAVALSGLPAGYGTDDIFADGSGQAYLWLPNGDYEFTANGKDYHVSVEDANATTRHWFGLMVNGSDIAFESGEGWTFDGATVSLTNAGPFVLSTGGATFTDDVGIVAAASCAVTFSNLVMDVSAHQGLSPFTMTPGTETALTLAGTNLLAAGDKAAGLTVSNATDIASLVIDAADASQTLSATGGKWGAGIGGGDYGSCGAVMVAGGTVTAVGKSSGAGIGGGLGSSGGTVTISGGVVTATGGTFGAGIGGGDNGAGGTVAINGGTVTATGGIGGAGIGGGDNGAGGANTFTGGSILASSVGEAPTDGSSRVWPVSVTGLADGAAVELPWLPAGYGTNDLVAVGGEVCVWLPTGDYPYGEAESDGAGGWRRHAVLVDAEGNVTLDGWVTVSPLSSLTITGFALAPDGTATIAFGGDGDLAGVSDSLAVDVSATPDFATLLAPASINLAITGATGTFTVSPPASAPPTLFFRVRVP